MHGKGHAKVLPFRYQAFVSWLAIGSLVLPVSWLITRNLGWNLDVPAVFQSQGRYASYKDWSAAEEKSAKFKRAIELMDRERKRAQEQKIWKENQRTIADQKTEQEARARLEEEAKSERIRKELDALNNPITRQKQEEEHREHLRSVGCLDSSGEVIRSLFCLNTEAPP